MKEQRPVPADPDSAPGRTPYATARARVRAGSDPAAEAETLVQLMSLAEKLGCLDGDTDFWAGLIDMTSGGYYRHPFPAAVVERIGFPGLHFCDGPRGVVVGASTCFPVAMARGASFDPGLEERIGQAIGVEARIQGADFFGGVCVNLLRHPAWGRAQETYGEDPFHVGEMGAALVRGVQRHAMACVKHFACNSIENSRFQVNVVADRETLDDVYLPHFRRVVREGVAAVMSAYNAVNGTWCGDSRELLHDILRDDWSFDGIVVSDFVYGLRDPVGSVRAGLDIEMPFRQQRAAALPDAVADGSLAVAEVDAAVLRIVATVLRFDAATPDAPPDATLLAGPAHRALAREAASASIVMLRNEAVDGCAVLPIRADRVRRIAVLGRLADVANLGDGGSSNVHPPHVVTALAGLRDALPGMDWTTDADQAGSADLAIVVVGCTLEDEGEFTGGISPELFALMPPVTDDSVWGRLAESQRERLGMALGGDRRSLALRGEDEELITEVAARQPRTVVLLMGGSAITVEPWIEGVAAVLQVWYPGMEGGHAIADVLTGASDPGGRLPFAVPTDEAHLPFFDTDATEIRYDAWHGQWLLDRDGHRARFPFGFGLSYADFELEEAQRDGDHVVASLRNTSAAAGSCVVFAFRPDGPTQRLVAFRKVRLDPGEQARVRLTAAPGDRIRVGLHAHDPRSLEVEAVPAPEGVPS
ncbi:MAG: glycoside hydrolase family 3 C-terminal domain-containing protein [Candidatus Binatia bacterium]